MPDLVNDALIDRPFEASGRPVICSNLRALDEDSSKLTGEARSRESWETRVIMEMDVTLSSLQQTLYVYLLFPELILQKKDEFPNVITLSKRDSDRPV